LLLRFIFITHLWSTFARMGKTLTTIIILIIN
jgi:hypothetical protein